MCIFAVASQVQMLLCAGCLEWRPGAATTATTHPPTAQLHTVPVHPLHCNYTPSYCPATHRACTSTTLKLHPLQLPSYTLCLYIYYNITTPPLTAQLHTVPVHLLQCNYTPPTALQHTVPVLPLHCDSNPSYCHATHCTQHISCKEPVLKLLCK